MKLYAYTTPDIPKHDGFLKIGETNGNIEERVKQQGREFNVEKIIVWQDAVITERISIDKRLHRFLKEQGFYVQQFGTGHDTEWVKCTVADLEKAFEIVREQLYQEEIKRQEVTNEFYIKIRNWYYWTTSTNNIDSEYALRLVVRLLFCYFLCEKGLVPKELFDEQFVQKHIKEDEESGYYNAILRNLFFHCLNTPMAERRNIKIEHEKLFKNVKNIKEQFDKIPFLNGGLFNVHVGDDIPLNDDYFFSKKREREIPELGGKHDVWGLIRILSQYEYKLSLDDLLDHADYAQTIDPEFIGKVFESLLACIDADSKETRRKVTGSYYTPREIVDYMVDEALDAYLGEPATVSPESLLQCKILDPACGSGAFPCGIMNAIMRRLDPDRTLDQSARYRRKLEIVRKVIYGVDIQPIAVQITQLRLFLSLIQEIVPDKRKDNYGIEPLPNLETKFVCADALIGLEKREKNGQRTLESPKVTETIKDLQSLRSDYFMASTVQEKERIRKYDATLRRILTDLMEGAFTSDATEKLAAWSPYNQFHSSPFFDSVWMFGVEQFDIVIGNPPYNVLGTKHPFLEFYRRSFRCTAGGKVNLYKLFFEKGLTLIKDNGLLVYITPYNYLTSADSVALRNILLNETTIIKIVDYEESQRVFESSTQAVAVILTRKQFSENYHFLYRKFGKSYTLKSKEINRDRRLLFKGTNRIIKRMNQCKKTFDFFVDGWQGEINVSTKKEFFVGKRQKGYLPLIRGNQIGHYETVAKPTEFCPANISARSHHKTRRIVFQEVANSGLNRRIKGTILENVLCGHTVNYVFSKHENIPLEALLGLLNSRAVNYYFKFYNQTNHVPIGEIKTIPVPDCISSTSARLAKLVTRRLNGELVEQKIDALVYELYGLTDEEIALIEKEK